MEFRTAVLKFRAGVPQEASHSGYGILIGEHLAFQ